MFAFTKSQKVMIAGLVIIISLTACIELSMGRSLLGPDGRFGWWDGNLWGNENSQRFADAYSFSHIVHGIVFYSIFWLLGRKVPIGKRFLGAVLLEAIWEVLENSPMVIDRYREATIALRYVGDSVLNSCSDILMMTLGFLIAFRLRVWTSVAVVLVLEVGCLLWIRDNLTLNIIMLIHPIDAIKAWQTAGQVIP